MGTNIPKGAHFIGVPLLKARNILAAWRSGNGLDAHAIAIRKNVDVEVPTVMAVLDEFQDRGLIGAELPERGLGRPPEPFLGLTQDGLAVAAASGRKRTPKAKAGKVLYEFLKACQTANDRDDLPFVVEEVWLFGSMLNDERLDVGDVDFVMETALREGFTFEKACARYEELAEDMQVSWPPTFLPNESVIRRLLFGKRRNPLLSSKDIDTLKSLGCPVKMVFDRKRNGRVGDPVLPMHPLSTGRTEEANPPLAMPNVQSLRGPALPVSVAWTQLGRWHWKTMAEIGPWPDDDEHRSIYRLIMNSLNYVRMIGPDGVPDEIIRNVVIDRLGDHALDGRKRFALIVGSPEDSADGTGRHRVRPEFALVAERTLNEGPSGADYELRIKTAANRGRSMKISTEYTTIWALHMIARADCDKLAGRASEAGTATNVRLRAVSDSPVAERIVAGLRPYLSALRERGPAAERREGANVSPAYGGRD